MLLVLVSGRLSASAAATLSGRASHGLDATATGTCSCGARCERVLTSLAATNIGALSALLARHHHHPAAARVDVDLTVATARNVRHTACVRSLLLLLLFQYLFLFTSSFQPTCRAARLLPDCAAGHRAHLTPTGHNCLALFSS